LAALNGFRPKFRQIAQTLTDVDLVFVEEAMERWMLEYDRAFACMFPLLFFSLLPLAVFRSESTGYRLMDSDSYTIVYLAKDG